MLSNVSIDPSCWPGGGAGEEEGLGWDEKGWAVGGWAQDGALLESSILTYQAHATTSDKSRGWES